MQIHQEKYCPHCGKSKSVDEFTKNKTTCDGLFGYCRECKHGYEQQYLIVHPRDKTSKKIWSSEYYSKNKAFINNRNTSYYIRNKRVVLEGIKRYRKENPEAVLELNRHYQHDRRALVRGASGNGWTIEEERQLIEDYNHRCAYCGKKAVRLSMDHIVPLSRSGEHSITNIVPACTTCNGSKHNKPLLVWMYKQRCAEAIL